MESIFAPILLLSVVFCHFGQSKAALVLTAWMGCVILNIVRPFFLEAEAGKETSNLFRWKGSDDSHFLQWDAADAEIRVSSAKPQSAYLLSLEQVRIWARLLRASPAAR